MLHTPKLNRAHPSIEELRAFSREAKTSKCFQDVAEETEAYNKRRKRTTGGGSVQQEEESYNKRRSVQREKEAYKKKNEKPRARVGKQNLNVIHVQHLFLDSPKFHSVWLFGKGTRASAVNNMRIAILAAPTWTAQTCPNVLDLMA